MSILSILLVIIVFWIMYYSIRFFSSSGYQKEYTLRKLKYGRSIGLFALVTGILGQLIGLYMAFSTIEQVGDISPTLVFAGLKVSMITTMYGMVIYLFSVLLWFVASTVVDKRDD